jgi:N-acetylneuraminic acid mutarotase
MKKTLVILVLFNALLIAQTSEFEVFGEMPLPVAGGQAYVDMGNIYVLGGYSDSTQSNVNWIQKYSTFLQIWKLNVFMQHSRSGFVADRYENSVVYWGGIDDTGFTASSIEQWVLQDPPQVIGNNEHFKRINSSGIIHNGYFYIIGGNSYMGFAGHQSYIVEYRISDGTVTYSDNYVYSTGDLPEQQMCARLGDVIYIFGGIVNGVSQKIYAFNTLDHNIQELNIQLMIPRAGGVAIADQVNNQIYIIGGYNETSAALNTSEIFKFEGGSYSINPGPGFLKARRNFTGALVDNYIYILGGYDSNNDLVNKIERYAITTSSADNSAGSLFSFQLKQNFPNPFNPSTLIKWISPSEELTSLIIFDVLGNQVAALINEVISAGEHEIVFDAAGLSSGTYFYQLKSGNYISTKKMIYLK